MIDRTLSTHPPIPSARILSTRRQSRRFSAGNLLLYASFHYIPTRLLTPSQFRGRSHKPLLALPSPVPFQVSSAGQISRYSTLTHLDIVGKDYTYRDAFDLVSTVTSPCGATTVLNVNSDLRVNNNANPGGRGLITTDSVSLIYSICVSLLKFSFSRRSMVHSSRCVI